MDSDSMSAGSLSSTKPFSTTKEWYEYIVKINDRNLLRQKANGLTSWALLAMFATVLLKLIDSSYQFYLMQNRNISLVFQWTSVFSIFLLIGINIILIYALGTHISIGPRCMGKLTRKTQPIIFSPIFFFLSLGVCSSFLSLNLNKLIDISNLYQTYFLMAFLTYIALLIYFLYYPRLSLGKDHEKIPKFEILNYLISKSRFIVILLFINSLILGIGLYFSVNSLIISSQFNVIHLKIGLYIASICLVLLFLSFNISSLLKISVSEKVESQIVIDQLAPDKIKHDYTELVLGETTKEWYDTAQKNIKEKESEFTIKYNEANKKIEDVSKLDENYKHEIIGRSRDACKVIAEAFNEYNNVIEKYHNYYRTLYRQFLFSDMEEIGLKISFSDIAKVLIETRAKKKSLCNNCPLRKTIDCFEHEKNIKIDAFRTAFDPEY